ncbi:MAG: hypothetical protein A2293_10450 [Elusimicrobia bacterium RIFOXYB2_FULL_49_7]|nr:MAG: hypothetical protein A2293_10450 [Elusimicrobia bacterium RIFOXYB2_FULL_49_7]
MQKESGPLVWAKQIRAPFLILSIALVCIGCAAAYQSGGKVILRDILLLLVGVVLTHISVNLFNELSDYNTKIDENTVKTPFSGGSGMMQSKATSPKSVEMAAYLSLGMAGLIGLYFTIEQGWPILLWMGIGGLSIRFYTSHLSKLLIGEWVSGLSLGSLVVMGCFYVLTGHLTKSIVLISIPAGLLTSLLLFLNEFPDAEADKKGGRVHLVIFFGKRISARLYGMGLIAVYSAILFTPFLSDAPKTLWLALLTLPLAANAARITLVHHSDLSKLLPAMGLNVGVVILTDFLIALGFWIA